MISPIFYSLPQEIFYYCIRSSSFDYIINKPLSLINVHYTHATKLCWKVSCNNSDRRTDFLAALNNANMYMCMCLQRPWLESINASMRDKYTFSIVC